MKMFIGTCAFLLVAMNAMAQSPSTDQQNKILAEAQRKLDSVMKNDPNVRKYMNKNNPQDKLPANMPKIPTDGPIAMAFQKKPDTAFLRKIKIPPKDPKVIASLPAKTLTKKELIVYIADMSSKLKDGMKKVDGEQPVDFSGYSANSLSNAAVMCWYTGQDVADRSLEFALDAATKDPGNIYVLNNLGAVLTLCAFPEKSIPILDYVNQQQPGNSTVTNNLGQAYLLLGDQQKATQYLQQTVQKSSNHPNANFSLACINYANGKKSAAQSYCENSLRGAYIGDAWTMLKAINPKAKLMELIRQRYKQPDFFNPHKYPLPEQCEKPEDAEKLKAVYEGYKQMLMQVKDKYRRLMKPEEDYIRKNMANDIMKKMNEKKTPLRPFGEFARVILGDISETHGDDVLRLQEFDTAFFKHNMKTLIEKYKAEKTVIDKGFADRSDKAGEGNPDPTLEKDMCDAHNKLYLAYLPQFASLYRERQQKWLSTTKDYYNDYAFWCYVASTDDHEYHRMFYSLVQEYLTMLEDLAHSQFLGCTKKFTDSIQEKAFQFEEGKCPFNGKIDVEVEENGKKNTPASFEIDCDNFTTKFKMENGISFTSKTNVSGATTLAFNGGLNVGEVIGGKMQFYMTFGGNQPFDVGFNWDYNMNLPDAMGGKNSAGWGVSINNGVDFRGSGKLQSRLSSFAQEALGRKPDAPQVNPNVKMYNQ
ncbi:MAG: hypothetical protein JST47_04665 [Bacteroidetes bacterium]|nr:hypothetical protein [Bacteroidota bacterium]MBS1974623.1 hypothetical protein [Bacteroidota bacterium]